MYAHCNNCITVYIYIYIYIYMYEATASSGHEMPSCRTRLGIPSNMHAVAHGFVNLVLSECVPVSACHIVLVCL